MRSWSVRSSAASPKHAISSDGHIPTGSASLILVAVDDSVTRQMVVNYLEAHQMRALSAPGREAMMSHLAQSEPDLAILDLRLGQDNGLDLLRDIRSRTDVPVIIGADDSVTTPFGIRELLARVRAVLRRNVRRLAPPRDPARGRCRFGGWQLDRRSRRLTNPDGTPVPLTKAEYALLIAFLDAPQRPLTRKHLLQATRVHEDVFDRSIDVQILRLRRKLEADPSAPRIIQTERGFGYLCALPVEPA